MVINCSVPVVMLLCMAVCPCMLGNATFWYPQSSAKAQQQSVDGLLPDSVSSLGKCSAFGILDHISRSCLNYLFDTMCHNQAVC